MKQITIVSDNRVGLVADITEALAARSINIETLDAHEVQGLGIVMLTVTGYDEALQALRDAGFEAVSEDAVVVRIRNEPGALAKIARRFKDAGIDLRSLRIIRRVQDWGLVAVSLDRPDLARELLKDILIAVQP